MIFKSIGGFSLGTIWKYFSEMLNRKIFSDNQYYFVFVKTSISLEKPVL